MNNSDPDMYQEYYSQDRFVEVTVCPVIINEDKQAQAQIQAQLQAQEQKQLQAQIQLEGQLQKIIEHLQQIRKNLY